MQQKSAVFDVRLYIGLPDVLEALCEVPGAVSESRHRAKRVSPERDAGFGPFQRIPLAERLLSWLRRVVCNPMVHAGSPWTASGTIAVQSEEVSSARPRKFRDHSIPSLHRTEFRLPRAAD